MGQGRQLNPDRQTPLQFRQQVRRLGKMKRPRTDKQDMVGFDHAVLGRNGGSFNQRQQIALNPFAGNVAAAALDAAAYLVDFIDEDNAVVFHRFYRAGNNFFVVKQLVAFLLQHQLFGIGNGHFAVFIFFAHRFAENIAQADHSHLGAGHAGNFHRRHGVGAGIDHADFDFALGQGAFAQHFAKLLFGIFAGGNADQRFQNPFFGSDRGLFAHLFAHSFAGAVNGNVQQIADNRLHIAADIAYLGKFGCFHLNERRFGQPCQTAGNFGFADAGGTDHQNVLGHDFLTQVFGHLHPPPAVAQSDRHRLFGLVLADNEAVQLGNNLTGTEICTTHRPPPFQ